MGLSHLHTTRASALPRKGRRRLRGYTTYIDHTGLVHVVPKTRRRVVPIFPLAVMVALAIVFKSLAMLNVGLNTYESKVIALKQGGFVQQMAGTVMMQDPASTWLYGQLKPLFL